MDVWGITLATLRRWYVFLPILAAAVLLALAVGRSANPEYEASGSMLLTPARSSSPIANPFVNAQGASEALTIILNGPETKTRLNDSGLTGTVTVSSASRSSVIAMRSVSTDPEKALALIDAVIDIASDELTERQQSAGIGPDSLIGLQVLAAPSITSVANDTAIRVQAVILGLGAVAGITLAVLFDDIVGLIKRRRQRRPVNPKPVAEGDAQDELTAESAESGSEEAAKPDGAETPVAEPDSDDEQDEDLLDSDDDLAADESSEDAEDAEPSPVGSSREPKQTSRTAPRRQSQ